MARHSIAAGADLVLFSGDKLLGGPQAGILAGARDAIQQIEKDPLMRAFRLDKMTLAALEATLRLYLTRSGPCARCPCLRMLARAAGGVALAAAENLAERLREIAGVATAKACADEAFVGGGSLPDQPMKTWVVELAPRVT